MKREEVIYAIGLELGELPTSTTPNEFTKDQLLAIVNSLYQTKSSEQLALIISFELIHKNKVDKANITPVQGGSHLCNVHVNSIYKWVKAHRGNK